MVPSPPQVAALVNTPKPASSFALDPTRDHVVLYQPHPMVERPSASARGHHCGQEKVGRHPLAKRLDMLPARSAVGLLSSLPTLTEGRRLWRDGRGGADGRMDGKIDRGMNQGMDVEMDGGINGGWTGMDGCRLVKVKYICVQTLLTKEKDCPPPCLLTFQLQ